MSKSAFAAITTFLIVSIGGVAEADQVVQLVDGTKITGTILHYYEGLLTVRLPDGKRMRLPEGKVKRVDFKLKQARSALSTPEKAFSRLRKAALKGDLRTYVDAHATYYQTLLNHQVAIISPLKFTRQLRKQWGSAQLEVVGTKRKGALATLKVRRKKGERSDVGELHFVRENGEWKMVLPL